MNVHSIVRICSNSMFFSTHALNNSSMRNGVLDCTRQPTVLHLRVQEKITENPNSVQIPTKKHQLFSNCSENFVKIPYIIHVEPYIIQLYSQFCSVMLLKIQRKMQKSHVIYGAQRRAPLTPAITYCNIHCMYIHSE